MPAITVEEKLGRRGTSKQLDRQFVIRNASDEATALTNLLASAPAFVGTYKLTVADSNVEELADGIWLGTAVYSAPSGDPTKQNPGDFSISFDISGQTQKRLYSINTVTAYNRTGAPARLFNQAINVNADKSIDGVDVIIPTFTFTLNYTADPADINESYVATLARTVGKVNSAAYKDFAAGELLLTRVSGSRRNNDAWDISFGFGVSENKTGLTVGSITGIVKDGWDYLWVYYGDVDNPSTFCMDKIPDHVRVERVYDRVNFATTLNLP